MAGNGICMEVADDGRSFKYDPAGSGKAAKRLGLLGMQERMRLINGKFNIVAKLHKGTTVRVTIPFAAAGTDNNSP
jgi:signal transduction histidine kinase